MYQVSWDGVAAEPQGSGTTKGTKDTKAAAARRAFSWLFVFFVVSNFGTANERERTRTGADCSETVRVFSRVFAVKPNGAGAPLLETTKGTKDTKAAAGGWAFSWLFVFFVVSNFGTANERERTRTGADCSETVRVFSRVFAVKPNGAGAPLLETTKGTKDTKAVAACGAISWLFVFFGV